MAFGLTPLGFVIKQQAQILTEINAALQNAFGANINLGPQAVFGQLAGIFSEREALIWQLAEAVYNSQYPAGAEGTSVDNILALNNLSRLQATATITNPSPLIETTLITLFGLVLYGTPGTVIPAGSSINNGANPPVSFTLNTSVTIAAAVNALQTIFFSNTPNAGSFSVAIEDLNSQLLTTEAIPYNAIAAQSLLNIATLPAASSGFKLVLTQAGVVSTTATITTNSAFPTSGAIQSAIQALTGYSGVTVSGASGGYTITWGSISNPLLSITANTTGSAITAVDSVQASFNNLLDSQAALTSGSTTSGSPNVTVASGSGVFPGQGASGAGIPGSTTVVSVTGTAVVLSNNATATASGVALTFQNFYPYTDVVVTGSFSSGFAFAFGAGAEAGNNPDSGAQPQAIMLEETDSLQSGSNVTNLNIVNTAIGAPAQGVGNATCTATGPNFVGTGTLNVIGTPISGWTGVTNQLDCITGTNLETDTQALTRRSKLLAAQANGPLQSIIEKVLLVPNVITAIGFQNLSGAAQQVLTFSSVPVSGNYTLNVNGLITGNIAFNATALTVETAIRMLSGYSNVLVSGTVASGFVIDFNGAYGSQAQPLVIIASNTTGVTITPTFGRPPSSFEIVVSGGSNMAIAQAIYGAAPAGIASYASPVAQTSGSTTAASTALTVSSTTGVQPGNSIFGPGIAAFATVISVGVGTVTMSLPAMNSFSGNYVFNNSTLITDQFGNPIQIGFSRPQPVQFYVALTLVTDTYNTPGTPSSGVNPNAKFQPGSILGLQEDVVNIGNAVSIGGLVIGFGTNGLIGAFNSVPGIISYTLFFGTAPSPGANTNIQLQPEQQPVFSVFNTAVTYT